MHPSVAAAWLLFITPFEGSTDFMYLDMHKASDGTLDPLVTTGIGDLIDPVEMALRLPWRHRADNRLATPEEIQEAWNTVKSRKDLAPLGGGHFRNVTDLYLAPEDVSSLVQSKLKSDETILRQEFPAYDVWPADAQLALLGMSWAMGPSFSHKFPRFTAAVNRPVPDFATAAKESFIFNATPARNAAHAELFGNAARVIAQNGDPTELVWTPHAPPVTSPTVPVGTPLPAAVGGNTLPWLLFVAALGGGLYWSYPHVQQWWNGITGKPVPVPT